jgi:UDP-glucose 4-epimerase
MNILLTGATGFVGKALFPELLSRKYQVTCVFRETVAEKHQQMTFNGCHRFEVENIDGNTRWTPYLTNISQIVHLAGMAHVPGKTGGKECQRFFSVNHEGTRNLAIQAARQGVKRFVFMSSVLVNGSRSPAVPFCETDRADPQNVYAAAKYEAETSLKEIGGETGMEVVILRPPLVYGPGVKANFLKLLDLVYAGVPLPLGAVSNRRSFISLKNLVDAVCLCLAHEKAGNQTFVVSDGEDLSTSELIAAIAAAMNRPCRLFNVPEKVMKTGLSVLGGKNVYDRLWGTLQVDSSRIRTRLGWRPPVTVEQGIAETVDWYLNNRRQHVRLKM